MKPFFSSHNLKAGYGSGDILKGISFDLEKGKVMTVIGPNGSGKSTLIKTLAGLLKPSSGDIFINESSIVGYTSPQRIKLGMSYVPQEYNVFRNMTVKENLQLANEFMRSTKKKKTQIIDDDLLDLFPELTSKFDSLAGNLSGGQRQMVAFACALAYKPEILLLDEPSAGLSPKYMGDIFEAVKKVNELGVTVFMVEQNAIEALQISDKCIVMANGNVKYISDAKILMQSGDLHSLYLGDA